MVDEKIVIHMAKEYGMNPSKARRLLEMAREKPAVAKMSQEYDKLREGDSSGQEYSLRLHRCL